MTLPRAFDPFLAKPRWVIWKVEIDKKGEKKKPPLSPHTGQRVGTDNPKGWGTYSQAVAAVKKYHADGIGIVLGRLAGDDYYLCGIEIDQCLNDDTVHDPIVLEVLERIVTYTEVSPSGRGLHLLFIVSPGDVDALRQAHCIDHHEPFKRGKLEDHEEMSLHLQTKYYTVTGEVYLSRRRIERARI
jgi:hypothetical protein